MPRAGVEPAWPCGQRIFLPATTFAAAQLRVWSLECASTVGLFVKTAFRSPPSTLYTCRPSSRVRIGSALPRESRGFADFDGIRQGVSAAAAQYCLSPLRLPISPSGPSASVYLGSSADGEMRSGWRGPGLRSPYLRLLVVVDWASPITITVLLY